MRERAFVMGKSWTRLIAVFVVFAVLQGRVFIGLAFGEILTPDGLRFIIEANDYDARKIGQHFLDMLPKIRDWTKKEYE